MPITAPIIIVGSGSIIIDHWTHDIWFLIGDQFESTSNSHGFRYMGIMEPPIFRGHDLDLLGSRDVICHVTIGLSIYSFL